MLMTNMIACRVWRWWYLKFTCVCSKFSFEVELPYPPSTHRSRMLLLACFKTADMTSVGLKLSSSLRSACSVA